MACVALKHAPVHEVMLALRAHGIRQIAAVSEPSTILVHDSKAQVKAALELI